MDIEQAVRVVRAVEGVTSDGRHFNDYPLFAATIVPTEVENTSSYRVEVRARPRWRNTHQWERVVAAIKEAAPDSWWAPVDDGRAIEVRA